MNSLRSRSAANARQARISSCVSSGKSRSISCGVIPPARYSRTSCTVILIPRMHGLPLRLPGSIVMIFVESTSYRLSPNVRKVNSVQSVFRAGRELTADNADDADKKRGAEAVVCAVLSAKIARPGIRPEENQPRIARIKSSELGAGNAEAVQPQVSRLVFLGSAVLHCSSLLAPGSEPLQEALQRKQAPRTIPTLQLQSVITQSAFPPGPTPIHRLISFPQSLSSK